MLEDLPIVVADAQIEPAVKALGVVQNFAAVCQLRVSILRPKYFVAGPPAKTDGKVSGADGDGGNGGVRL